MNKISEKELLKTPIFTVVEKEFEETSFKPVGLNCPEWVILPSRLSGGTDCDRTIGNERMIDGAVDVGLGRAKEHLVVEGFFKATNGSLLANLLRRVAATAVALSHDEGKTYFKEFAPSYNELCNTLDERNRELQKFQEQTQSLRQFNNEIENWLNNH